LIDNSGRGVNPEWVGGVRDPQILGKGFVRGREGSWTGHDAQEVCSKVVTFKEK